MFPASALTLGGKLCICTLSAGVDGNSKGGKLESLRQSSPLCDPGRQPAAGWGCKTPIGCVLATVPQIDRVA